MKVSVVVRSRNDIMTIEKTLERLRAQRLPPGWELELVNIDNQSLDGTADVVRRLNPDGVVLSWPVGEYMPGAVLNFAVGQSQGKIVLFNNADAVPDSEEYVANLMAPLLEGRADAVFGRQTPRPNARCLVRKDYERAFGDGRIASHWKHFFSLAAAGVRRSVWSKNRFREDLLYSEDIEWSWRLKKRGFRIQYVENARVEHSHNYTLRQTAKRFYNEGVADLMIFGGKPSWLRGFLLPFLGECRRDIVYLARHDAPLGAYRELWYRFVQHENFYQGRRRAAEYGWWR